MTCQLPALSILRLLISGVAYIQVRINGWLYLARGNKSHLNQTEDRRVLVQAWNSIQSLFILELWIGWKPPAQVTVYIVPEPCRATIIVGSELGSSLEVKEWMSWRQWLKHKLQWVLDMIATCACTCTWIKASYPIKPLMEMDAESTNRIKHLPQDQLDWKNTFPTIVKTLF